MPCLRFFYQLGIIFGIDFFKLLDAGCEIVDCTANYLGVGHIDAGNEKAVKGRFGITALKEVDILSDVLRTLALNALYDC